jgi:hypothetical protein
MEYFFQWLSGTVGQNAAFLDEEAGHLALPSFVHFSLRHFGASTIEIRRLEIANQKPV